MPKTYEQAIQEKQQATYRHEAEIRKFWLISKDIRMGESPKPVIDKTIELFLKDPAISDWLRHRMEELKELNRSK